MIDFLQRVLAVSDNEEIRNLALGYLGASASEQQRADSEARYKRFNERWLADLQFVKKDLLLVIGPPFDPARCAGYGHHGKRSARRPGASGGAPHAGESLLAFHPAGLACDEAQATGAANGNFS